MAAERPPSMRAAREPDDVAALTALHLSSAAHHVALDPDRYRVPDEGAVAEHVARMLADPRGGGVLVAEVDGVVAGFLRITRAPEPPPASMLRPSASGSIEVAVAEGHRGRGIGTALLDAAADWARSHGLSTLVLDTLVANDGAVRLYERKGYHAFGALMESRLG